MERNDATERACDGRGCGFIELRTAGATARRVTSPRRPVVNPADRGTGPAVGYVPSLSAAAAAMLVELRWIVVTFLLALTVAVRGQAPTDDVTTGFHGDESSDVTVSSSTASPYVNPRPGKISEPA